MGVLILIEGVLQLRLQYSLNGGCCVELCRGPVQGDEWYFDENARHGTRVPAQPCMSKPQRHMQVRLECGMTCIHAKC